jgi:rhodanese-related sulfurtransferase
MLTRMMVRLNTVRVSQHSRLQAAPSSSASSLVAACLVVAASLLTGCDKAITDTDIQDISLSDVQHLTDEAKAKSKPELVLLMDPRRPADFYAGHIPQAKNVQIDEFQSQDSRQGRIPAYEKYGTLVVYGFDPASSLAKALVKRLLANDYKEVYWFRGGIKEWMESGLPLEKGKREDLTPR